VATQRRKELQRSFAPELAAREPWLLEAVDAISSGSFWDTLRGKLSARRAAVVLRESLHRLLA
jgi:hypothetical protein